MTYSQKYCLVHFVQPIKKDTGFSMSDWPPHITLADVFAIDRNATDIDAKLKELLLAQPPVTVAASQEAVFGTTHVVLIEKSDDLMSLHEGIIRLLQANSAIFNTPEFMLDGFLPHSTVQSSGQLNEGNKVNISSIYLIDMFPNKNWQQRKVLSTFKLHGI